MRHKFAIGYEEIIRALACAIRDQCYPTTGMEVDRLKAGHWSVCKKGQALGFAIWAKGARVSVLWTNQKKYCGPLDMERLVSFRPVENEEGEALIENVEFLPTGVGRHELAALSIALRLFNGKDGEKMIEDVFEKFIAETKEAVKWRLNWIESAAGTRSIHQAWRKDQGYAS